MEKLSKTEIAKIINDSSILILPEYGSIEEALALEQQNLQNDENLLVEIPAPEHDETDFERIFQLSLDKRQSAEPLESFDYYHLLPEQSSTAETKPDIERAIELNRTLKVRLIHFRQKLMNLVSMIDAQYRSNNIFLEQARSSSSKNATCFKTSYVKCGAPFFKDALSYPAPFNDDYKYRKNVLKEFFPFDLPQNNSRWRTKEKAALVSGVKSQMINHIKSQQSKRLCEDSRKTRGKLQKLKFISQSKDLEGSPIIEIYESIQRDYPDFSINWNLISFDNLQSGHSVSECMGMWYSYLRPDLNRNPFTEEEDSILTKSVTQSIPWSQITDQLDRRSILCAFVHFHTTFSRFCPSNVRWTDEEDAQLMRAIERNSPNGATNWNKVGQAFLTRSKTQCYNRHQIIIKSQNMIKGVFSREEDKRILDYVSKLGENAWNEMPKEFLPGRTIIQIRNHFNVALKHKGTVHPWTREEDKILVDYVEKFGTNNWAGVSAVIQTHNRISCRTRYVTISKFLSKNPDKTVEDVPSKLKKVTAVQKATQELSDSERESSGEPPLVSFKNKNPALYLLLRTTHNYDLGARNLQVDNEKLKVLLGLFKVEETEIEVLRYHNFTSQQLAKIKEVSFFKLGEHLVSQMNLVKTHTQFLLPPNLNTSMGLRAVTIKLKDIQSEEEESSTGNRARKKYKKALEDFQKMYFSLFYWTAMLTKVDISELNEIHFIKDQKTNMTAKDIFQEVNRRKIQAGPRKRTAELLETTTAKKSKVLAKTL